MIFHSYDNLRGIDKAPYRLAQSTFLMTDITIIPC